MTEESIDEAYVDNLLDSADTVESVTMIAQLAGKITEGSPVITLARVPTFSNDGIPQHGSSVETRWGIATRPDELWGILEMWWPNGTYRTLKFNLKDKTGRTFVLMLHENRSGDIIDVHVTNTPSGQPDHMTGVSAEADQVFESMVRFVFVS